MKCTIFPYQLYFHYPFKIAHTSRSFTANAYVLLQHQGFSAWGEATFPPYVEENFETFRSLFEKIRWPKDIANLEIPDFIGELDKGHPGNPFALAALDIALHNLKSAILGIPIKTMNAIPNVNKTTSVTLGISDEHEMAEKIKVFNNFKYFKLKVSQEQIGRIVTTYQQLSSKPFVIDANQGFSSPDLALSWCKKLHELGCDYLEQPFSKSDLDMHKWLKKNSPIPIIADESFQRLNDLESIKACFHGINVKLMKCAGISEAYKILMLAKKMGMKTIIGCMSESSVAVGAAWNLAPLADWVDLDGPYLIKNDLFAPELNYSDKQIIEMLKNG